MTLLLRKLRRFRKILKALLTAPWPRRKLAFEAGCELLRARIQTLRATKSYISDLGELGRAPADPDPAQIAMAGEIGHMVAVVAHAVPFRAVCLQQAIAVRRMLRSRNIPAKVYLGLSTTGAESPGKIGRDAHAWVETGPLIVAGDQDLDRFAVVATFG